MDKYNRFKLFGVLVCCTSHSKISHLDTIRGMTAYGAYINEDSLANKDVFDEIKSRCSGEGDRILVDTNPDYWLKVDYIDKDDSVTIKAFQYELDDNTFLNERYRERIKASTPEGMFYDRNIKGLWCSADGVVYKDFNKNVHYIEETNLKDIKFTKYLAGVDWGYEHFGSIVVIGEDDEENLYLLEKGYEDIKESGDPIRYFVIVDEAADIAPYQECKDIIVDIGRRGGAAGFRLIYATQYPTNEALPSQLR